MIPSAEFFLSIPNNIMFIYKYLVYNIKQKAKKLDSILYVFNFKQNNDVENERANNKKKLGKKMEGKVIKKRNKKLSPYLYFCVLFGILCFYDLIEMKERTKCLDN